MTFVYVVRVIKASADYPCRSGELAQTGDDVLKYELALEAAMALAELEAKYPGLVLEIEEVQS